MEFWGSCVHQIRTEFATVDKMLHSVHGVAFPAGNSLESKAIFREFWEPIEFYGLSLEAPSPLKRLFCLPF